ncbi:MAG: aminopeptidase P family protein [Nitrospirales bacterium]|nr:aminopeptidase P family protein [Nitrospira sp.]MDR4501287.1 aminopeptidase P family protein [Nitrospirales bacterium]
MTDRADQGTRVAALRTELRRQNVDGLIIPHADEYQNEYTPDSAERLRWVTGFSGSAGTAVVLEDRGAIFVDGRYVLQVKEEVNPDCFIAYHSADTSLLEWLTSALGPGVRLGYDPWLHTPYEVEKLQTVCQKTQAVLIACEPNPIDRVWIDRPDIPCTPMVVHPLQFSGKDSAEKRSELAQKLKDDAIEAVVVTAPDSLAWLLNVRGRDVSYSPLSLCMAIVGADGSVQLFIDAKKLTADVRDHLGHGVSILSPEDFGDELKQLGSRRVTVQCDPEKSAFWIIDRLSRHGATVVYGDDPCTLPKARKNSNEIRGMKEAHLRDGVALCRFLSWLDREGPSGRVTELEAAEYLEHGRRQNDLWQEPSFPTISGAGPHGAIVHYRSTPETNARLERGMLYLVDSGAQYLDGTTDVTRTVAIGKPTSEQRDRYTRVLKGHVGLAMARFPKGTTGGQLDALARKSLWDVGLDYDHGTGHGVGSYLGVHEGPQRIAKKGGAVALQPGMIVSNEPGYYKAGEYGIRIENLVLVVVCADVPDAERELLSFETLTLAPFDRELIERSLLLEEEVAWVDAYHARVFHTIGSSVDGKTSEWLQYVTRPL